MLKQLVRRKKSVFGRQAACEKLEVVNEANKNRLTPDNDIWQTTSCDALRVDILSSDSTVELLDPTESVTPIRSLRSLGSETILTTESEAAITQDDDSANTFSMRAVNHIINKMDGKPAAKSIGVFSDSRIYSAMIKHEIKKYDAEIKHFNHPNTYATQHFPLFDTISAWIVFLSEENDDDFLDQFLDRYVEKPTLFLFEKTNRLRTTGKIKQFAKDNGFID